MDLENSVAQFIFTKPQIKGIVTTVGSQCRKFSEDLDLYGLTDKEGLRLSKAIGLDERRVIKGNDVTTSDLCIQSAKKLIEGLGLSPSSISAVIFVSQTPDYAAPSTASSIQNRLKIHVNSMAFDIRLGCSGFVYGLSVAFSLVQSGLERVLLCVGDVASRLVPTDDHSITPIMGDAGSAILIESGNSKSFFQLYSDGSGERALYVPNSGYRNIEEDKGLPQLMKMDGAKVFNFTLQRVPSMIYSMMSYSNSTASDVDYFILHQPNKYILNSIQKKLSIEDSKFPKMTQSVFGNQNSASIPGTISGFLYHEYSERKIKSLFSGFGIGLSWAACVLETSNIYCPKFLIQSDNYE